MPDVLKVDHLIVSWQPLIFSNFRRNPSSIVRRIVIHIVRRIVVHIVRRIVS